MAGPDYQQPKSGDLMHVTFCGNQNAPKVVLRCILILFELILLAYLTAAVTVTPSGVSVSTLPLWTFKVKG